MGGADRVGREVDADVVARRRSADGAIIIWFVMGITGAAPLGQQSVDIPTIAGGPIALRNRLNQPVSWSRGARRR